MDRGVLPLAFGGRKRGWFWLLAFVLVSIAGASGAAAGNHAAARATATLRVSITGLPPTSVAAVAVTGPHGFGLRLTKTATRKGLKPGWYKIAAAKVKAGLNMYVPTVVSKKLHLIGGKSLPVSIKYKRLLPSVAPKGATPPTGGVSQGAGSGSNTGTPSGGGSGGSGSGGSSGGSGGGGSGGSGSGGSSGGGGAATGPSQASMSSSAMRTRTVRSARLFRLHGPGARASPS